jgi:small subunit ribosomal protein S20
MAITSSAKKAYRSSLKKQIFNVRRKRDLHEVMKDIKGVISSNDRKGAQDLLPKAYKAIDKATKRGVIKKNTASRKKSRLVSAIKKIS